MNKSRNNIETQSGSSNKIAAIHQPNYIPWLGYFYKIYQSDIFVFLDDAQFSNEGMHNYCYIKTPQGSFRLKIPVKQSLGNKINEVQTRYELKWNEKHLKTIEFNYRRAKNFREVYYDISELIGKEYLSLASMNSSIIKFIAGKLGIITRYINSSELDIAGEKEERILKICNKLGSEIYYSGTGAKAYQNEENFNSHGIELRYSVFNPFKYPQLWDGFQPNVTIIDFLMNCGYDWERVINSQKKNE